MAKLPIKITVEEKTLCPRYTARVITDVKVGESPDGMKKKLAAMTLRPVNNIVDITNFCLFETGEPMHAFDLDKIDGGEVIIRKAKKGEKIVTIDGVERMLDETILVIADKSKPIAIAGVMGGLNTEVNWSTKNILLESASFDPISVRRTARKLALASESSYRFERRVDVNNIEYASARATALISGMAGGTAEQFTDIGKKAPVKKAVTLRFSRLNSVVGLDIPAAKAKKIITTLGLKIKKSSSEKLELEVPQFRHDINAEIDMIEEVARIYGYHKVPSTIPAIVEQVQKIPPGMALEEIVRRTLAGCGADEIITYSLLGRNILSPDFDNSRVVEIRNPLSSETEIMRPCLMPGMLQSIAWNINRKAKDLKFFEIGKAYSKESDKSFKETKRLSVAVTGEASSWAVGARQISFFDLKGMIEAVLCGLGVTDIVFKETKDGRYSSSCAASITASGDSIGTAGEVSRNILAASDIKENVFYCELDLEMLLKHAKLDKRFQELPKYPSVYRDMSVIVDRAVFNADIASLAVETGKPLLKKITLIDRYAGKQIPDGKVGLTYRLEYRDPSKTLEEKGVVSIHSQILRALEERFGAKLR